MEVIEAEELVEAAEELSDYELERGKPMPSKKHGLIQARLSQVLLNRYDEQYAVMSELKLDLGTRKPVPDICLYPKSEISWDGDEIMTKMPLLTIEILSRKQALSDLEEKVTSYLAAGVKSCWIVLPTLSEIVVYHASEKPKIFTEGDVKDDVAGVTVSIAEIFR